MKRTNFTHLFKAARSFLLLGIFLLTLSALQAQVTPGVCRVFRQTYAGGGVPPPNALLNPTPNAPNPVFSPSGGSGSVIEISGPNTDPPSLPAGAIPPGHTIYKVTVQVSVSHPRASELDIALGYTPPTAAGAAPLTPNLSTRWVTLTSDNGGNLLSRFPTFDDDADQGTQIDYPTSSQNDNFVTARDYANASPLTPRIVPEEALAQLVGLMATNAAGGGGAFFIAIRDDTPSPTGTPAYDATLGGFTVTLTTIPTVEYGGPKYSTMGSVANSMSNTPLNYVDPLGLRTVQRIGSTTPPDSILNNATIEKKVTVTGGTGRVLTDVDVRVALRHTYMGDLAMSLTSPMGTTITLMNRKGGNIDINPSPSYLSAVAPVQPAIFGVPADQRSPSGHIVYPSLVFSDDSDSTSVTVSMFGTTIASQATIGAFGQVRLEVNDNVISDHDYNYAPNYPFATANGTTNIRGFFPFTPEEALGAFVGEDGRGTWTLKVTDNNGRDVGVLDRFELALTTIPKPCILDVGASISAGAAFPDSLGSMTLNVCSNQFPLDGTVIRVDTLYRHNALIGAIGSLQGTTIQIPLGTTVFQGGSTNTALSTNPRVRYDAESFVSNAPVSIPVPDPALRAAQLTFQNFKRLLPFFSPPPIIYPNTLPRHGLRLIPQVPASQSYCRYPARSPVTAGAPNILDQNPTDSIGAGVGNRPPVAVCKEKITITLDTVVNPGVAIVKYQDINNGSSDDLTREGKLQYLTLGSNIGANTALATDCSTTGVYQINYANTNSGAAYTGANSCPVLAPTVNSVKIQEPLTSILGKGPENSIVIRVRRPTTGAPGVSNIQPNDFRVLVKYNAPLNGGIVTRTYTNAALFNVPASGNFTVPLTPTSFGPPLTFEFAEVVDVSVDTRFTVTSGKVSSLSFDLGNVLRDSLRFTTFPRTVTCADIGKPTKIMLVVKDRANQVDSCYTNVMVMDGTKPTITCGTDVVQTLPTVNDCAHFLTIPQVQQLAPIATDNCLPQTSLTVPLQRNNSIAPGLAFILENTTDKPMIIESLDFPVLAPRDMYIRAFILPINLTAAAGLNQTTYPASSLYPILNQSVFAAGAPPPPSPNLNDWRFWGQNIIPAQTPGVVSDVNFVPKNYSNLTFAPGSNTGVPYAVAGDPNIGAALTIPAGQKYGVYLAAFAVDANGYPAGGTNNTSFGIVHSNVTTGGIVPSYPFPLPATGAPVNTVPPLIVRGGWNTSPPGVSGNEFESPGFPVVANPGPPPFAPFSAVFENVVNFPLSHTLTGAPIPIPAFGGTPRMFAGKVNYVFGEPKSYVPALGPNQGANTDVRNFILPVQGPRATVNYFQKVPVFTPGVFTPNVPRTLFTYDGIKQVAGIDFQKPYAIGKTINVFQVTDKAGNTATCSQTVEIIPAAGAIPPQLICNDHVNISLDDICSDTLKASEFLANTVSAKCLGAFRIEILNGTNVLGTQTGNYVGTPLKNLVGGTYTYKVYDASGANNFCWGTVKFEDKFAPRVVCPENITVDDCSADLAVSPTLLFTQTYSNPSAFSSNFTQGLGLSSSTIPVNAPSGSKLVSIKIETKVNVTAATQLSRLQYFIVTPSGGQIFLGSRPGLSLDANGNEIACPGPGVHIYNFDVNSTLAPLLVTSGYLCSPANGTYPSLEDLNDLIGIPAEGDWYIQFQEVANPGNTGAGAITAALGDFKLTITMEVPVEKATVQELCTDNLVPLLAESTKTNTCVQDTSIVRVVKRTYSAKDAYGNLGTCSHNISFKRAKFRNEVFPNDIVLDCSYNNLKTNPTDSVAIASAIDRGATIAASYKGPWFDNNGNPHINVVGKPRPFTCTSYSVNYTDMRIDDICGSGNGSYAVRRTWKVYDACENKAIEHQQYISVQDVVAPTIAQIADATISTPVNACTASLTIPVPTISDNCNAAADLNVVYELYQDQQLTIPAGAQSPTKANVFDNVPTSSVTLQSGVLVENWYFVKYTVTDKCGNTRTATSRLKVTDRIAPIAACAPLVKVSLTSDGTAVVDAQEFDRGSSDNCGGIARYQVWRMDDGDCVAEDVNGNGKLNDDVDLDKDGFADYPEFEYYKHPQNKVKFCCADIGDTVMVIFRVWDNSPTTSRNSFRPTEPNYDYGIGNRGNVNICMSRVLVEDKLPAVIWTEDTTAVCGDVAKATDWLDLHKPQPQLPTRGFEEMHTYNYFSTDKETALTEGTTSIKFPVSGLNTIRGLDLNVKLNFNHTNIGNLFAELVTPSGSVVTLFRQPAATSGLIPYTSTGSTDTDPFFLTFDDEPSLNPQDLTRFTRFDLLGLSGTDVTTNDIGILNRKYLSVTDLAKIEGEDLDGEWTLRMGEINPALAGAGKIGANGVSLEFCGYPESGNLFYSADAAPISSDPNNFSTTVVIPVNGIDTIQDINIRLNMHHTNIGNLQASLTSPEGTTVELFVQPTGEFGNPYASPNINGTPGSNLFRLTFNDEPSVNPSFLPQFSSIVGVGDTITPQNIGLVNGKYLGLGQFSAFDGQNANGNWILTITRLDPTVLDSGAVIKGGAQLQIASKRISNNKSYFFDNCEDYVVCYSDTVKLDNCGNGFIKRAWMLSDAAGRTAKDDQFYTSTSRSYYSVLFPKDTILTCVVGSTDTSYTGKPKVNTISGCPNIAVSYTDEIANAVANACYRIKRTWKVVNLCQNGMMKGRTNTNSPDVALMSSTLPNRLYKNGSDSTNAVLRPDFDTDGYVEYVQIISVNDKTAPTITDAPAAIPLQPLAKECKVKITIPAVNATDACSNTFKKSWEIFNKATNVLVAKSDTFPANYTFTSADFGKIFKVRYTVGDNCGNIAIAEVEVAPKDEIKPTPICYQGLSADLLPTTNNVMIAAKQFDAGSYDANDCTTKPDLRFFVERAVGNPAVFGNSVPTETMLVIDCKGLVAVRLWVVDAAGNADFCDTYVDVQNNMNATAKDCDPINPTGSKVIVNLTTLKNQVIKNADVKLDIPANNTIFAKASGNQYLGDVPSGSSVTVTPEKTDNPLNGVSTFDLVLMTKHILAVQPITDAHLLIAADINNNKKVTTADVVELRKMILAVQQGFSNNKSWRFFDTGMKESVLITNILKPTIVDFTGVKIGDINKSANAASPKTTGTFQFDVNEKSFVAGEEVKATFNAAQIAGMEGYQFTLGYDKDALELANIEGAAENFGVVENGNVTTSWNGNAQNGDNLFTMVFKAKKAGNLSEMLNINSKFTSAEAYTKAGEYNNVALKFNGAQNKFALYQNQPNPFMGRTIVGFNLPVAEHAKMTIYDITGRVIKVVEGNFNKGYNEVTIDEILGSGVLNYKLETATETATKSMIILE